MTSVWVYEYSNYDDYWIIGVYSTEELALAARDRDITKAKPKWRKKALEENTYIREEALDPETP
jgi:hypothetical protein